jgi:pimeloyl-ACP methyl ester carboxylesterase
MAQHISYPTVKVDGLSIFYREAGLKDAPTILLLHGLPSSSRMFASAARLADRFHMVADYPGLATAMRDTQEFSYV